jgi:hypothetical protein
VYRGAVDAGFLAEFLHSQVSGLPRQDKFMAVESTQSTVRSGLFAPIVVTLWTVHLQTILTSVRPHQQVISPAPVSRVSSSRR